MSMTKRIPIAPCKGCTERTEYCHGTCERYQKWKDERQAIVDNVKEDYYKNVEGDNFMKNKRSRFRAFGNTGRKR